MTRPSTIATLPAEQLLSVTGGFNMRELAHAGWNGANRGAEAGANFGGEVGDAMGRRIGGIAGAVVSPTPHVMAGVAAAGGDLGRWGGMALGGAIGAGGGLVAGTTRNTFEQLSR